nr:hypothetical protein CPGR_03699 [Mycolicibacterium fortuitum subsp. fortuitum DSM 46621 = ATCC 6841 = JCM 6387]CRL80819.1 hypothetical protein CPGR_04033 [Mycolicibacter nonchromogenicus]
MSAKSVATLGTMQVGEASSAIENGNLQPVRSSLTAWQPA